jgi:hypothetical protein
MTPKDAHHPACHFITCDDPLAKRAQMLNIEMEVINPIDGSSLFRVCIGQSLKISSLGLLSMALSQEDLFKLALNLPSCTKFINS